MRCYRNTALHHVSDGELVGVVGPRAPGCVEIVDAAEDLRDFVHPDAPPYVFGPEDGSVPKGVRSACHRFVRIPAWDPEERTLYNLAFAVGAVLYDRLFKLTRPPRAA
jgi:tRNA(Leu) C34 or U34 (ribose-2'-O)-methylase TrmL